MNKRQHTLWLLATVAFAVCLTVVGLSYIVTEPWHVLTELGGDGAKNIFTYLYNSMYGTGFWLSGMNYPYGEHIVFTDGFPLLSVFFAATGNVSAPTALTALWLLIGLGYVLSIVFVYKILLRQGLPPLAAMFFAGLIAMLTPQWIKIRGHYALAMMCVLPMLYYWTLAYHEEGKWRNCVYIFLMGCIVAFMHPYYAGIILVWVMTYSLGYFIFNKQALQRKLKHLTGLIIAGGAIPAVVMIIMKLTDPLTDRAARPYNPIESYTNIPQILTSYFSPFWEFAVNKSLVPAAADGGEGFTYIGLVPIMILLLSIPVAWLRKKYTHATAPQTTPRLAFSPIWLFMAAAALVLSMGIPMKLNLQWLMDYLIIFKQFRSLGRFSWIFYFIITVFSAVTLYQWFSELILCGRKKLAWSLLLLSATVWSIEAAGYMRASRKVADMGRYNYEMMFSVYEQKWESFLKEQQLTSDSFQAILLLPYFHIGSDKIWVGEPGWIMTLGYKASLQLQLPMINAMMARSSWHHAQQQAKIAAGPYSEKPLLRELKSSKPFLLLRHVHDSLPPDQAYLLQAADYIGTFSDCSVYACYPERMAANDKHHADTINTMLPYMTSADTCVGSFGTWYTNHFDEATTTEKLFGTGSVPCIKQVEGIIAVISVLPAADSVLYEYSCWFLLGKEDYRSPSINLELNDQAGRKIKTVLINTSGSTDSYGMWFRASGYFYIPNNCGKINCRIVNSPNPTYIAMDEMQLRPAESIVISKCKDGTIMVNNHRFKTAK
jgi:hypothetical protein